MKHHARAEVDAVLAEFTDDVALAEEVVRVRADRDRFLKALETIDQMNPDDYRTGQDHLLPAFREINWRHAFRFICRTINGALHGTDEDGNPLPKEE